VQRQLRSDDPLLRFIRAAWRSNLAYLLAWVGRGGEALAELGALLPALERGAGGAPYYRGSSAGRSRRSGLLGRADSADVWSAICARRS